MHVLFSLTYRNSCFQLFLNFLAVFLSHFIDSRHKNGLVMIFSWKVQLLAIWSKMASGEEKKLGGSCEIRKVAFDSVYKVDKSKKPLGTGNFAVVRQVWSLTFLKHFLIKQGKKVFKTTGFPRLSIPRSLKHHPT